MMGPFFSDDAQHLQICVSDVRLPSGVTAGRRSGGMPTAFFSRASKAFCLPRHLH